MKTEKEIKEMLQKVNSDERLSYPPANVFVNAPLALVQVGLEARKHVLQWILEIEPKDNK